MLERISPLHRGLLTRLHRRLQLLNILHEQSSSAISCSCPRTTSSNSSTLTLLLLLERELLLPLQPPRQLVVIIRGEGHRSGDRLREFKKIYREIRIYRHQSCQWVSDNPVLFSDCACDWQMGGSKKKGQDRSVQPVKPMARRRDSEDEESEISAMIGTSDDKQRLAQTRAELRGLAKRHSVWPPLTRLPLAIFSSSTLALRKYL